MSLDSQTTEPSLPFVSPEQVAAFLERDFDLRRRQTDRMLIVLMAAAWTILTAGIWWLGPRGAMTPPLRCAAVLGLGLTAVSWLFALMRPGQAITRQALAVTTVLSAVLTIHLTAGHASSLFPLYAALALISLYLEYRLFATALAALAGAYLLLRFVWPAAFFGPPPQLPAPWLERFVWMGIEAGALLLFVRWNRRERSVAAARESHCEGLEGRLRRSNAEMEKQILDRTAELRRMNELLEKKVQESAQAEEKLQRQERHDNLTGLPNRSLFTEVVEEAIEAAKRDERQAAVLYIDIDRFKQVNDSLGHGAGDRLLVALAERMKGSLRQEDTLARIGGDEFTDLLPDLPHARDAAKAARKLLDALGRPVVLEDREVFFTASIGISAFPGDGQDAETLTKLAGIAMQRTKEQGRGHFQHYAQPMTSGATQRFALESDLRKAQANQELLLFYQAQVGLATGRIDSVETLVRWRHPEKGLISPGEFIPLAEETGLIVPMGEWVLRTAAQQAARWHRAGRPLRVSVNISARQFEQRDLIDMVGYILKETGLPPDLLELELTESCIMDKGDRAVRTLESLKALGVRLAIDDFGTGYSSLAYLRRFPMDVLKIDRSFVMGLETDRMNVAIVRAVSDLAHAVGLEVVAEGVETPSQQEILRTLQCDLIQGYLYSRPVPLEEFAALVDRINGPATVALAEAA